MSKFISMEDAAKILGLSVEQLSEMQSNNEIFGYRDGSNWKFKLTELERVAGDLDIKLNMSGVDLKADSGFDLGDDSGKSMSSLLRGDSFKGGAEDSIIKGDSVKPPEGFEESAVELDPADFEDDDSHEVLPFGELDDEDPFSLKEDSDSIELSVTDGVKSNPNVGTAPDLGSGAGSDVLSLKKDGVESGILGMKDSDVDFDLGLKAGSDKEDDDLLKIGAIDDDDDLLKIKEDEPASLVPSGLNLVGDDDDGDDSGELRLASDSGELKLEGSAGDLRLEGGSGKDLVLGSEENILDDESPLSFGASSLTLASETGKANSNLLDDDILSGGTGKLDVDDNLMLPADDEDLFGDDLGLGAEGSSEDSSEDSDLVLDDSDSLGDLGLESNKSGIGLSANASGIFLDEPLELGGSDIDALELPEDDDMIVLEDAGTSSLGMTQEDDFNLTPLESPMDDDDSSGSQVIALEDSEIFADDAAATMLGGGDQVDLMSAGGALEPLGGADGDMGLVSGGGIMDSADPMMQEQAMMMPQGGVVAPVALPEAPYSIWQVLSLGIVATLLVLGGMVGYNIMQNMWIAGDEVLASGVLDFFLKLIDSK